MKLLTDEGARVAVVAICMMAVCSGLLGVILGWWLRGREVERLRLKVEYLRLELTKAWASKASVVRTAVAMTGMKTTGSPPDTREDRGRGECGAHYDGPLREHRWMRCSKPKGHDRNPKTSMHGYAGVFWA